MFKFISLKHNNRLVISCEQNGSGLIESKQFLLIVLAVLYNFKESNVFTCVFTLVSLGCLIKLYDSVFNSAEYLLMNVNITSLDANNSRSKMTPEQLLEHFVGDKEVVQLFMTGLFTESFVAKSIELDKRDEAKQLKRVLQHIFSSENNIVRRGFLYYGVNRLTNEVDLLDEMLNYLGKTKLSFAKEVFEVLDDLNIRFDEKALKALVIRHLEFLLLKSLLLKNSIRKIRAIQQEVYDARSVGNVFLDDCNQKLIGELKKFHNESPVFQIEMFSVLSTIIRQKIGVFFQPSKSVDAEKLLGEINSNLDDYLQCLRTFNMGLQLSLFGSSRLAHIVMAVFCKTTVSIVPTTSHSWFSKVTSKESLDHVLHLLKTHPRTEEFIQKYCGDLSESIVEEIAKRATGFLDNGKFQNPLPKASFNFIFNSLKDSIYSPRFSLGLKNHDDDKTEADLYKYNLSSVRLAIFKAFGLIDEDVLRKYRSKIDAHLDLVDNVLKELSSIGKRADLYQKEMVDDIFHHFISDIDQFKLLKKVFDEIETKLTLNQNYTDYIFQSGCKFSTNVLIRSIDTFFAAFLKNRMSLEAMLGISISDDFFDNNKNDIFNILKNSFMETRDSFLQTQEKILPDIYIEFFESFFSMLTSKFEIFMFDNKLMSEEQLISSPFSENIEFQKVCLRLIFDSKLIGASLLTIGNFSNAILKIFYKYIFRQDKKTCDDFLLRISQNDFTPCDELLHEVGIPGMLLRESQRNVLGMSYKNVVIAILSSLDSPFGLHGMLQSHPPVFGKVEEFRQGACPFAQQYGRALHRVFSQAVNEIHPGTASEF